MVFLFFRCFTASGQGSAAPESGEDVISRIRPRFRPLAEMFSTSPEQEPTAGNTVRVIGSGLEKLDLLSVDMMNAEDYIHMEYFEFFRDPGSRLVRTAMNLRGEDSLEVRYIVEDFMNIGKAPSFFSSMKRHGVEVGHYSFFHLGRRNHQKIVVIDGKVGYTGGMNIGNHYFHEWRDTHLRLTGPCVGSLEKHFLNMWERVGGEPSLVSADKDNPAIGGEFPLPDSLLDSKNTVENAIVQIVTGSPAGEYQIKEGYIWMLDNASGHVYMQTPYFTPPKDVLAAMKRAVERGVEVWLILPEKSDMGIVDPANRSYYKECLSYGVRIFETKGKFDHSKLTLCDDYLSSVGSANLDGRSLKKNFEINTYIYGSEAAAIVRDRILSGMAEGNATEVTMEMVGNWSAGRKIGNALARMLAPQL
ncbi:MAG: hypothetical protein IJV54_11350 [Bacteroidales bacterium]|nr:hypothetical protein [Bacteroidales bacterium]